MDKILVFIKWGTENYKKMIAILIAILTAILGILALLPGDQGESRIQSMIDFLSFISK